MWPRKMSGRKISLMAGSLDVAHDIVGDLPHHPAVESNNCTGEGKNQGVSKLTVILIGRPNQVRVRFPLVRSCGAHA